MQEFNTQAFDLQVQKFSLDTSTVNVSYSFADDTADKLIMSISTIANMALRQNVLSSGSSFCVLTTHYKYNLMPLTKNLRAYMSPYSSSYLEF